jgi:hypothetical protein
MGLEVIVDFRVGIDAQLVMDLEQVLDLQVVIDLELISFQHEHDLANMPTDTSIGGPRQVQVMSPGCSL